MSAKCGHDGWQAGCPNCEREERAALEAMGAENLLDKTPYADYHFHVCLDCGGATTSVAPDGWPRCECPGPG
jgi:hypothetical protein